MEKLKMTIPQFSKTLAQSFQKYSIVPLIKEYIEEVEEANKSWRFDLTSKKDKKSILKECKRGLGFRLHKFTKCKTKIE